MPIPKADKDQRRPVVQLVDKILAVKQHDAEADTTALVQEIDRHVYALYGLTDDEIKLVEDRAQK